MSKVNGVDGEAEGAEAEQHRTGVHYDALFLRGNALTDKGGSEVRRIVVELEVGDSVDRLDSTKGQRLYGPQAVETLFWPDGGTDQRCFASGQAPPPPRECLDRHKESHMCTGPVTGEPSRAGTGTVIFRCRAGHDASEAYARKVQERYPDTSTPPDWFDASVAGESWDEEW